MNRPHQQETFSGLEKKIFLSWEKYRPTQVVYLRATGDLKKTVEEAARQHAQIFAEATRRGMGVGQADEIARQNWLTPEINSPDQESVEFKSKSARRCCG